MQGFQDIHPTAHVRSIDDPGEDDNSKFWAEYTVRLLGRAPDVVTARPRSHPNSPKTTVRCGSPEYGREYCEKMQAAGVDLRTYQWRSAESTKIARGSRKWKTGSPRQANRILICDTDVLSTGIWHERYMGTRSPEVESIAGSRWHDLYLLTDCDLPFVQDGLRDGETIRQWMTNRFERVLTERRLLWVRICGFGRQRLDAAVPQVDKLLASFEVPLGR